MTERATYFRPEGLPGVEALHARFVEHEYRPHSHPTWTIAVVERGAARFEVDETRQRADRGELFVLEPEAVHTGMAAVPEGWAYKVLYLEPALLHEWAERDAPAPRAARWVVFRDRALRASLLRAHDALAGGDGLEVDARMVRDVGLAEDLAQDALERWPETGVPDNPGAWLMATAKHRAIDQLRRRATLERKQAELGRELEDREEPDLDHALDDQIGDDLLSLVFTTCHPVLATEARIALTLRMLGGLTTVEIARAFLVPSPTVGQRISRAKRTLAEANVPFEVPAGDELRARLGSVLEVVYLIFSEGYSATAGDDWMRPELCREALRLGRILAELAPREPEVHGLVALMEIQQSRAAARVGPNGEPVLLLDQDRSRWDRLLIRRGVAALERAQALGEAYGPYTLQAAIAGWHARARTPEQTEWARIVALYDALAEIAPSPVVDLNRAVAIAMAFGPEAGLAEVERLAGETALARLPPAAERARRTAGAAGPPRRGERRVRPRGVDDAERARAGAAARTRG